MRLEQAQPERRVAYVPRHANGDLSHKDVERGSISSANDCFVFVKFDQQVSRFGWQGTTAQACDPENLVLE